MLMALLTMTKLVLNFACRAVRSCMDMLPHSFRLLPLSPLEMYEQEGPNTLVTSIFAAALTDPSNTFAIGAVGRWIAISEVLQQVSPLLLYH